MIWLQCAPDIYEPFWASFFKYDVEKKLIQIQIQPGLQLLSSYPQSFNQPKKKKKKSKAELKVTDCGTASPSKACELNLFGFSS